MEHIELAVNAEAVEVTALECESIELDIKSEEPYFKGCGRYSRGKLQFGYGYILPFFQW